jgi:hypothetical protein
MKFQLMHYGKPFGKLRTEEKTIKLLDQMRYCILGLEMRREK